MKKKINAQMIFVAIVAIVFTVMMMLFGIYRIFQKQVIDDLKIDAQILIDQKVFEKETKDIAINVDNLRVSWIDAQGNVLYDNEAAADTMENHKNRPEVKRALQKGEGTAIRKSDTMKSDTFYYAVSLEDGTILRVARDVGSLWTLLLSVIPMVSLIVFIMVIVCVVIAHFLTKNLMKPINAMTENLDDCSNVYVYKELVPFATTIRSQHENILEAAKMRQDFTANVSHELKTPLTAISGYAELIENKMVEENQVERFAKEIRHHASRLLSLINDIINLSELDRTEKQIAFQEVDLYEIAKNCVETLEVGASQHQVSITCEGESTMVRGNQDLLTELIINLGENAIRYNRENGKVVVSVEKKDGHVILSVKDNGIGIPKEHQKRVFERFYRVDKSHSRQTGGTGLGLAIVKHISAIHDAEIILESEVNLGTCIRVEF